MAPAACDTPTDFPVTPTDFRDTRRILVSACVIIVRHARHVHRRLLPHARFEESPPPRDPAPTMSARTRLVGPSVGPVAIRRTTTALTLPDHRNIYKIWGAA